MLTRVWENTKTRYTCRPMVEEHLYTDGTKHYSFRDRFGRPYDCEDVNEAMKIVREWCMEDVTEEYKVAGWIE